MPATPAIPTVRKIKYPIYSIGVLILMVWARTGMAAFAQDNTVPARVTYLAGQNIYLDAGRDLGIQPGDTLIVSLESTRLGKVRVVSSIADRSVVTFVGDGFPITRGATVQLQGGSVETPAPPTQEEPVEEAAAAVIEAPPRQTYPQDPTDASPTRGIQGPSVSGRVLFSMNTLQSSTKWRSEGRDGTSRTFATPSLNVHLNVNELPQGLTLRTRLRADYRYSSSRPIEPALAVHAYELLVEKDFSRFSVQAGRFTNRYASYTGYWDGALIHMGNRRVGVGTAVGFMPDRSNEGFSAEMPRYSGFAHIEVGDRAHARYEAEVSYNEIRPTNNLLNHRFVGLSHSVRWSGLNLRNDVQLDRDPETGQWVASRLNVRGTAVLDAGISLYGRYLIRQPYSIYRTVSVISYRRDQAGLGASVRLGGTVVGADAAFNFVEDAIRGRVNDGRTISGYVQVPTTGVWDLGFSSNASYWSADKGNSFYMNTGVSRNIGAARTRLQYQFYRTATLADPLLTHTLMVQVSQSLGRGFYTSGQVRLQQSSTLGSASLYTSLWYSF